MEKEKKRKGERKMYISVIHIFYQSKNKNRENKIYRMSVTPIHFKMNKKMFSIKKCSNSMFQTNVVWYSEGDIRRYLIDLILGGVVKIRSRSNRFFLWNTAFLISESNS